MVEVITKANGKLYIRATNGPQKVDGTGITEVEASGTVSLIDKFVEFVTAEADGCQETVVITLLRDDVGPILIKEVRYTNINSGNDHYSFDYVTRITEEELNKYISNKVISKHSLDKAIVLGIIKTVPQNS